MFGAHTVDEAPEGWSCSWSSGELYNRAKQARFVTLEDVNRIRVRINDTVREIRGNRSHRELLASTGNMIDSFISIANRVNVSAVGKKIAYFLLLREHAENYERRLLIRMAAMPDILLRYDIIIMCAEISRSLLAFDYMGRINKLKTMIRQHA